MGHCAYADVLMDSVFIYHEIPGRLHWDNTFTNEDKSDSPAINVDRLPLRLTLAPFSPILRLCCRLLLSPSMYYKDPDSHSSMCRLYLRRTLLVTACVVFFSESNKAQSGLRLEAGTFLPHNIPMPLTIHQAGEDDINLTARYASEPFVPPICWVWRVGLWSEGRSWELEVVHHKIYLDNAPPEIGTFGISHGLNQITINRGWQFEMFVLRVGAGFILAHAESIIRGRILSEDGGIFGMGYHLTGPTLQAAVGRHFPLFDGFIATTEVKLSGYFASLPVAGGDARVTGLLAQLTLMVGWHTN